MSLEHYFLTFKKEGGREGGRGGREGSRNDWCFRPRISTVRPIWARWDEFYYESCPWWKIDSSTCWPAVQCATIELQKKEAEEEWQQRNEEKERERKVCGKVIWLNTRSYLLAHYEQRHCIIRLLTLFEQHDSKIRTAGTHDHQHPHHTHKRGRGDHRRGHYQLKW